MDVDDADSPRVADRLAAAATQVAVGRRRERAELGELVTAATPVVVFVHGPGGIGKTALVSAALDDIGARQAWLDGRHVEPTAGGLLDALSAAVGRHCSSVDGLARALAETATGVLVVDSYERFAVVDGWLRNELLPALPDGTTTVVVGRNPPNGAWRAAPGWRQLVADLVVGPLALADAAALVARQRLPPGLAERALAFGRGHPLALELAAEAFRRHPALDLGAGPPPEVVEELVDLLFDNLDREERRVIDAASVLRRVTRPLLTAVLDDRGTEPALDAAWRSIRDQPFVRVHTAGLEMQPVVQEAAATALELRDPGRTRELRRRAGRAALAEIERAPGWEATADLLHLVQNPVIRNAFLPPPGLQHPVERAHGHDIAAIEALVARHQGDDAVGVVRRWWDRHPDSFSVLRRDDGGVAAVSIVRPVDAIDQELGRTDPVVAAVVADVAARPVEVGERCLLQRRALSARTGDRLSPELAPMIIDLKRTYLAMRPGLARIYTAVSDWPGGSGTRLAMGFEARGDPVPVGRRALQVCALDFGPGSVDSWLARHVEAETAPGPAPLPGAGPTPPAEPGGPDALGRLSAREREVLVALAEGLTNRELAERLFISERTANRHLSNIFTKLGVHNRTAAARVAIDAGLC